MNTSSTITFEPLAQNQPSTTTPIFSMLEPLDPSTTPTFAELLATYNSSINKPEVVWNRLKADELDQPASNNVHLVTTHTVAADLASASGHASATGTDLVPSLAATADPTSTSGTDREQTLAPTADLASASEIIDQTNLTNNSSQPACWLWPQRLSLAALNLLDGDHGTGRSLLVTQLAACVSSGSSMPDGSTVSQ